VRPDAGRVATRDPAPRIELGVALESGRLRLSEIGALLWAVAPVALGGVLLRSRPGPARERWQQRAGEAWAAARGLPAREVAHAFRRVPPAVGEDRLLGALDVAASLAAGRCVQQPGLIEQAAGGVLLVPMAERLAANAAAHIGQALDAAAGPTVLAFDESEPGVGAAAGGAGEQVPPALVDRLVLRLDPDQEAHAERLADAAAGGPVARRPVVGGIAAGAGPGRDAGSDRAWTEALETLPPAARRWRAVVCADTALGEWAALALALGVDSLRALQGGVQLARVAAAVAGRDRVEPDDWQLALRLVLLPRATRLPTPSENEEAAADDEPPGPAPEEAEPPAAAESPPHQPPVDPPPADREHAGDSHPPPGVPEPPLPSADDAERIVAAALARLPPDLLAGLQARLALAGQRGQPGGRAGERLQRGARGAPRGAQRGDPRRGARLALVETLRAAAPWQRMRRRLRGEAAAAPRLIVLPGDLHIRRHRPKAATVALFVVDASGSAAAQRMAEAKGAVERLLADCYARRDQVGVIAFGGRLAAADPSQNPGVQLLLPPTRSLVRAKRCLAGLPGGGGTPLAAALAAAERQAAQIRSAGASPLLVLLTDGRANLGHRGEPLARPEALALAQASAQRIAAAGLPSLLIDISARPSASAQSLADVLRARYLPLPSAAPAAAMADAVRAVRAQSLPPRGAT
jgi:magnesium chelatase subunit D